MVVRLADPRPVDSKTLLRRWVQNGWRYRGLGRLKGAERARYLARIKLELDLMLAKGFEDYFLVLSDIVRWCKAEGIPVGPARGSAAASLVCWLLRITEVNPMLFPNLIFERFIDHNRHDLPDVDLDFDDELRYRVRERLVEKYGAERVGNIGTFTMYRGKNSLEDVAKVFGIPKTAVEEVKGGLLERSSGDLRYGQTIEDSRELFPKVAAVFDRYPDLETAQRLEGNIKGFSVHAAGLVVANGALTTGLAVYKRYTPQGELIGEVLSIDKHDAEYLNVLKLDFLGLTTMGLIRRALEYIGMTLEELYAVPLDDEKVYEGFRRNEVIGIFQFDGRAMRSVNREVKPDTFAEVCDINALARPGPLHSGAAAEYIMAKHKKKVVEKLHPVLTEITAHTNGQIVYQEQILRTVRELGGFTWEEAALVRKLISKKQGEQAFNRLMSKFMAGAATLGLREGVAARIWKQLVTAGAYAFNAAHCVSYACSPTGACG
jgi:DNA polymerase-3 subunit alpha